jgi:hypothetical protein
MKLLTEAIRKTLPPLHSQDGKGEEAIVHAKFFTPDSSWTWFATEGEPITGENGSEVDFLFFGLVYGFEKEYGNFSLKELESVRGPLGLEIERDMFFTPRPLRECEDPCGLAR